MPATYIPTRSCARGIRLCTPHLSILKNGLKTRIATPLSVGRARIMNPDCLRESGRIVNKMRNRMDLSWRNVLGIGRGGQMHFDARVVFIDVFVEVGFDDTVVIDAESLTEGILCNLQPAIDVSS